jgi:hypothetical protein
LQKVSFKWLAVKYMTDQTRYPELRRLPSGARITWLLAIAFAVAFWTLLIPVVTHVLVRVIFGR